MHARPHRQALQAVLITATVALLWLSGGAQAAPEVGQQDQPDTFEAYEVLATPEQADALRMQHYDITTAQFDDTEQLTLEIIMTQTEAAELAVDGLVVDQREAVDAVAFQQAGVYRSWSEPGGLADEMADLTAEYPGITDLQVIGQSVQGQDILAMRVTAGADTTPEGERPTVLYAATQHAREWITPEVNRRLLRMFLEGYGTDPALTELVDTRDLYFVIVANPDGYDHTFTEGNRLWRKNMRDNDGDGRITIADGRRPQSQLGPPMGL